MLRLYSQACSQDFPSVYDPRHAFRADPLYRMGKELSLRVRITAQTRLTWDRAHLFPVLPFACYSKLFGEDDEDSDETELEKAKADGEDGERKASCGSPRSADSACCVI